MSFKEKVFVSGPSDFLLTKRLIFVFKLLFCLRRSLLPLVDMLQARGYFLSLRKREPVDTKGIPVPWYTYSAIDFLKQLSFQGKRVFEYGFGNSILWWGKQAESVTSVEQDAEWFDKIKKKLSPNITYCFSEDKSGFIESIDGLFDVIIIDAAYRDLCANEAVKHISENGMIILDDSQRGPSLPEYQRTVNILQTDPRFIQIDFAGVSPAIGYTKITTFFISRSFDFERKSKISPEYTEENIKNEQ